ncbi:MAG: ribbon-helix-helix domain-containing protein [Nitrospiria bacterium]
MKNQEYHKKYTLEGESPLVRVTFLIPKEQYQMLRHIKDEEGIPVNFFVKKAIEKALKERKKQK